MDLPTLIGRVDSCFCLRKKPRQTAQKRPIPLILRGGKVT